MPANKWEAEIVVQMDTIVETTELELDRKVVHEPHENDAEKKQRLGVENGVVEREASFLA